MKRRLQKQAFDNHILAMVVDYFIYKPKKVVLVGREELSPGNWRLVTDDGQYKVVDIFRFNSAAFDEMVKIRQEYEALCERWQNIRASLIEIPIGPTDG